MPTYQLREIPEPAPNTRAIMAPDTAPIIKGENGDKDYLCAGCDLPLLSHLPERLRIANLVFKCPACGSFNEIP